ncbi:MAG TPA: 5-formyltetrahydrofolate cyclo-ligase [Candidatus Kapabacteria bacterium]|nr:5-formyltetrahydrofolate cyclo-ligase [Candidatus Kapabacteria bacterium]
MSEITDIRFRLRAEALRQRDELAEHLRIAFSHLIKKSATSLLEELRVQTVHCYLSFRSEVDTSALIHSLQADEVQIIAPVTSIVGGVSQLEHYVLTSERTVGSFGVPEPIRDKKVSPEIIEAVVVPLVAYDGTGTRLGYGKGYYDRFLASLAPNIPKIGLAFSIQEVYEIPHLPHDIRMDYIVNEQAIVKI